MALYELPALLEVGSLEGVVLGAPKDIGGIDDIGDTEVPDSTLLSSVLDVD